MNFPLKIGIWFHCSSLVKKRLEHDDDGSDCDGYDDGDGDGWWVTSQPEAEISQWFMAANTVN